jgi:hypothetical protein
MLFQMELSVKDVYKLEICQVCDRVGWDNGCAFSRV